MALEPFDLTGKVAAVTGAGRGIGAALAMALGAAGAKVLAGSRTLAESERTALAIRQAGGEASAARLDVVSRADCDAFVRAAAERYGRLDIMMSNAGISIPKPALDTDEATWRKVLDVDLTGSFNAVLAAGHQMADQDGGGAIVVTSSNAGMVGFANMVAYCAAKGGVDQMIRALAIEWAPYGIRVNGIAPGWLEHVMRNAAFEREDPRVKDEISLTTPLHRMGTNDEVIGPALFLASGAASFITGVIIPVDGGYVAV